MAKQTFTTGQVLTAAQVNSLQTNDFNQTVSAKTASYILVAADKGTRIEFNTSGSVTCTVNTGLFDAGDTLIIQNRGAGAVTITAGTATVNTSASLVLNQYDSGTLYFISNSAALWFGASPGDITGITTGATSGLSGGVTSGTADLKLAMAAKGDLLVGTGSGTSSLLTVGANNTALVADSTTATGLKWATASSGALTKVTSSSFSAVSTASVNNCFSSTYDYYRLLIEVKPTASQDLKIRWRASGTDATGSNYDYEYVYSFVTTVTGAGQNNSSSASIVYMGSTTQNQYISIDVYSPFRTMNTTHSGTSLSTDNDSSVNLIGGNHQVDASYDGFTLFPASSGTITGKVTVYGYQI